MFFFIYDCVLKGQVYCFVHSILIICKVNEGWPRSSLTHYGTSSIILCKADINEAININTNILRFWNCDNLKY